MVRYIDVDKFIESLQEELDSYPLLHTREQNEMFERMENDEEGGPKE